ncbi:MAG: DUF2497 domain-containing protein [Brevundimonas sp.]|uniref:DUF2497 domain-containing protein n=1 Tax=Brevundimonas sp. TaxID=1871086 RepID=UPI001201729E|nr:DUF2497 domain-containing protein [Brevundimonas sp.]RZJ17987.1 MAG: DUF2497 domain-containing protein [Brevundimonas sp.]
MTDQTAQEPTMEEILASIRRIISEDDAPAETAAAPVATPEPEVMPEPAAAESFAAEPEVSPALMDETPSVQEPVSSEEDVLELTDRYEAPASQSIGDLDVEEVSAEPFPDTFDAAPAASAPAYNPLVGESAAASAASAFAGLAASLRRPDAPDPLPSGPTLDELVRSLLRPMLKSWLDENLPAIVEAQVRKEVERIARNAG